MTANGSGRLIASPTIIPQPIRVFRKAGSVTRGNAACGNPPPALRSFPCGGGAAGRTHGCAPTREPGGLRVHVGAAALGGPGASRSLPGFGRVWSALHGYPPLQNSGRLRCACRGRPMCRPANPVVAGNGPMRASAPTGDPVRSVWNVGPGALTGPPALRSFPCGGGECRGG